MRSILFICMWLLIAYLVLFILTRGYFGAIDSMISFGFALVLVTIIAVILAATKKKSDFF